MRSRNQGAQRPGTPVAATVTMAMADRPSAHPPEGVETMQWDLGFLGLALLLGMSLGFGLIAQFVSGRETTRWLWLITTAIYFACGLFTSEVWFGWATEEELQPNIDGLSFEEVLLMEVVSTIVTVLLARYVSRRRGRHRPRVAH